jgi:DNA-binding XRE family transcriptional regulator
MFLLFNLAILHTSYHGRWTGGKYYLLTQDKDGFIFQNMPVEICDKCLGTGHPVDNVALGAQYRAKRKKLGVTMGKVAKIMNIDSATLCMLEQGKRNWTAYYAIRFEQALNILGNSR